ncbi:DedA family protein [Cellulomonas sp. DKR-3]|uniref:DedA family protein n=1 Tax=Cellulomonas fulva TaxID=2835530 RepID=A0ABS5TVU6_9CELL|nr:DedA family protein [Cellulomonas fulva]MBT0993289.1 DedA family protein [Cellulomonas fulva]
MTPAVPHALSATVVLTSTSGDAELTGLVGWVVSVIESLGPLGVGLLVGLENLFPPLPSEVVLPVAGYVASQGGMSLVWAVVAATLGSLVGAWALYGIGAAVGRARLRRWLEKVPLVEVADLDRAEDWFGRHGGTAVLVGRCVPVVRSLISVPAGVERMPLGRFSLYTTLGSLVWNGGLVVAGYALGERWEDIGRYSDWLNLVVYVILAWLVGRFVWARVRRRRSGASGDGTTSPHDDGGVAG